MWSTPYVEVQYPVAAPQSLARQDSRLTPAKYITLASMPAGVWAWNECTICVWMQHWEKERYRSQRDTDPGQSNSAYCIWIFKYLTDEVFQDQCKGIWSSKNSVARHETDPQYLRDGHLSYLTSTLGKNSCRGGSRRRIVTGRPSIAVKIPSKSSVWYWMRRSRAPCIHSMIRIKDAKIH